MPNIGKIVLRVILLATGLCFSATAVCGIDEDRHKLRQTINLCILNNQSALTSVKNCVEEGKTFLKNIAYTDAAHKDALLWFYAQLVRTHLGNGPSLELFDKALKSKTTAERCIDDGLDTAVKAGLNLPESFKRQISITQSIVFNHCWSWLKDEIIEMTNREQSSFWYENVCGELEKKGKNPSKNCSP